MKSVKKELAEECLIKLERVFDNTIPFPIFTQHHQFNDVIALTGAKIKYSWKKNLSNL